MCNSSICVCCSGVHNRWQPMLVNGHLAWYGRERGITMTPKRPRKVFLLSMRRKLAEMLILAIISSEGKGHHIISEAGLGPARASS